MIHLAHLLSAVTSGGVGGAGGPPLLASLSQDNGVVLVVAAVTSASAILSPVVTMLFQSRVQSRNREDHASTSSQLADVQNLTLFIHSELRDVRRDIARVEDSLEGLQGRIRHMEGVR